MIRDLTAIYKEVDRDSLTQLLLIYGASDRAFCAGGERGRASRVWVRARAGGRCLLSPEVWYICALGRVHWGLTNLVVEGVLWLSDTQIFVPLTSRCGAGDVAFLAKQNPVPLGKNAPQMEFFRAEYTLNNMIGNLKTTHQVPIRIHTTHCV